MYKILLFLVLPVFIYGQGVYYSEDFSSMKTFEDSGWRLFDQDGDNKNWKIHEKGYIFSDSWDAVALKPNNYAFTSAIDLTNATGQTRLDYMHRVNSSYDKERYSIYATNSQSVAATTTNNLVHHQATMAGVSSVNFTSVTVDLTKFNGQVIYLCFRHHDCTDNDRFYIDNIVVRKFFENHLDVQSADVKSIVSAGSQTFSGVVENKGSKPITSYDVTWQANGGQIFTHNVTGVNIAPNATHNFTHSAKLTTQAGESYEIIFAVAQVNGVANASTKTLTKQTAVPAGTTTMKPFIEKFTGNWCGPCLNYENSTFSSFYETYHPNFTYIAYHSDKEKDLHYVPSAGDRYKYYPEVDSYPSVVLNGSKIDRTKVSALYTASLSSPAYFKLSSIHSFDGKKLKGTINSDALLSGKYQLRVAVVENESKLHILEYNPFKSFKHVLHAMWPNSLGTTVTFKANQKSSHPFEIDLSNLNQTQLDNLSVVVYIQNDVDRTVYQSTYSVLTPLSSESFGSENLKLFPNPTSNNFTISSAGLVDVEILNMLGKSVKSVKKVDNSTSIDVSNLEAGVYFVNIWSESKTETIKLIKK